MAPTTITYEPRDPSHTVLYTVVAEHLETFLASLDAAPDAKGLPVYDAGIAEVDPTISRRAGQKVRRIGSGFGYEGESPTLTGPRCASVNGFSLHANTQVPAHRRDQLERLIR